MDVINDLFLEIVNMAWDATFVILAVLFARLLLSRVSKTFSYALWIVVALRLIFPVMISSQFSIFQVWEDWQQNSRLNSEITDVSQSDAVFHSEETETKPSQELHKEVQKESERRNINESFTSILRALTSLHKGISLPQWLSKIWFSGFLLLFLYGSWSYVYIKRRLIYAVRYRGNIYECDRINSPFVLGIFKPSIYIPFRLEEREKVYILMHENFHIKRRDYLSGGRQKGIQPYIISLCSKPTGNY